VLLKHAYKGVNVHCICPKIVIQAVILCLILCGKFCKRTNLFPPLKLTKTRERHLEENIVPLLSLNFRKLDHMPLGINLFLQK
jgi:hypothetical protein